jgi:hypothetical protein
MALGRCSSQPAQAADLIVGLPDLLEAAGRLLDRSLSEVGDTVRVVGGGELTR